MPELRKPERTQQRLRLGDIVTCEVVIAHDGLQVGDKLKIQVSEAVRYMVKEGYWKVIA